VKEEDDDWVIYHLILKEPSLSVEGLITASGLDPGVVDASLKRLERYLLIERKEGNVRAFTVGEALIRCQVKYSKDLPYIIEDGVIKERKT
jgi:predicted transcriptional regulator